MKTITGHIAIVLLISASMLIGCADDEPVFVDPPRDPQPAAEPAIYAQKPMSTSPTNRTPPPARKPAPGEAMVRMALPTGNFATSVLSLEKSAPKEVLVGKAFVYKIRMTNLTASPLKGVMLTGKLSGAVKLTGATPQGVVDGSDAKWNVGVLAAKQSKLFAMHGQANATGVLIGCSDVTFDLPQVCLSIKAVKPALQIVKTAPAEVLLCETIVSKIVVTNTGTGKATNIRVQDNLPDGVTTMDGKSASAYDFGDIPPGEARQVTIRTKATRTGKFATRAELSADDGLSGSADAATNVIVPKLAVDVASPQKRFVGRNATYSVTVTNKGDAAARDTVLTGSVPPGAKVVAASDQAAAANGRISWKLGTIKPGAARKVSMTLKMDRQGAARTIMNATAYCSKAGGQSVTIVKGIPAILLECVDLEDPIEVGAKETYLITVTNQGSAVGTNIVIQCTLPDEQVFVSATGPTKETVKGKVVTFTPLKSLAPKAKAEYRVLTRGVKTGDVRFKVSLKSDQMTTPAGETESTNIYSDE